MSLLENGRCCVVGSGEWLVLVVVLDLGTPYTQVIRVVGVVSTAQVPQVKESWNRSHRLRCLNIGLESVLDRK